MACDCNPFCVNLRQRAQVIDRTHRSPGPSSEAGKVIIRIEFDEAVRIVGNAKNRIGSEIDAADVPSSNGCRNPRPRARMISEEYRTRALARWNHQLKSQSASVVGTELQAHISDRDRSLLAGGGDHGSKVIGTGRHSSIDPLLVLRANLLPLPL